MSTEDTTLQKNIEKLAMHIMSLNLMLTIVQWFYGVRDTLRTPLMRRRQTNVPAEEVVNEMREQLRY